MRRSPRVTAAWRLLIGGVRSLPKRLRGSDTALGIALAIVVGLLAGLGAVGFVYLIKLFQWLFFNRGADVLEPLGDYYVILLPTVGGLLVGLIIHLLAREARGDGPPQVMEAAAVRGGRIRSRVAIVKALASSICIGSGGSVGREGPVIQIGSSLGSTVGQWLRLPEEWTRTLLLCGAAGGVSAMFNAPIGGVFFALEVLQRRLAAANLAYVVISSVTANLVAHSFLGDTPSFSIPTYHMNSHWEMVPYAVLGILCGVVAAIFIWFFFKCEDLSGKVKVPPWIKPAVGGLFVGLIGVSYFDVLGVGYGGAYGTGGVFEAQGAVDRALVGEIGLATLAVLMGLKILSTSLSLGSGGSGGTFAPSLFIGSMMGGAFGLVVQKLFPSIAAASAADASGSYALVGMGALFAAVVHGPITAIILLFEMTRDYSLIVPLMTAVVLSVAVSRGLNRDSIYTAVLTRRGVDIHRKRATDAMATITVGEAMTRDFPTVPPSMPVTELVEKIHVTGHHGFPVVDQDGNFCGIVTLQDIEEAASGKTAPLTAMDIATRSPIVAYPDQSIREALAQLGGRDVGRIPVVDRDNPRRLLGVLRRHDVLRAYRKAIEPGAAA